jgi:hypothetical protein
MLLSKSLQDVVSILRDCQRGEEEDEMIFYEKQKTPTKSLSPSLFYFTVFVSLDRN